MGLIQGEITCRYEGTRPAHPIKKIKIKIKMKFETFQILCIFYIWPPLSLTNLCYNWFNFMFFIIVLIVSPWVITSLNLWLLYFCPRYILGFVIVFLQKSCLCKADDIKQNGTWGGFRWFNSCMITAYYSNSFLSFGVLFTPYTGYV